MKHKNTKLKQYLTSEQSMKREMREAWMEAEAVIDQVKQEWASYDAELDAIAPGWPMKEEGK